MKVFSIDPNSNKYFEDKSEYVNISDNMYQGTYNYTPVYPRYTFTCNGRFNYMLDNNEIEFYTMLPIKRLLSNYLVEVRFRFIVPTRVENSLNIALNEFHKFCNMNKKELNIKSMLS